MNKFERIIADSMGPFYNMHGDEITYDDIMDDLNMSMDEYDDLPEYLDDFQGEEEFA